MILISTSPHNGKTKTLEKKLCEQLEHYFTDENLKNDVFMLKNMDNEGMSK